MPKISQKFGLMLWILKRASTSNSNDPQGEKRLGNLSMINNRGRLFGSEVDEAVEPGNAAGDHSQSDAEA